MKSTKYARVALKSGLLICTCCLFYFLSTGPAMKWLSNTGSTSVSRSLERYIYPLILIDRRFNNYKLREEALRNWDPSKYVSIRYPEPTLSHKTISGYMEVWGLDAARVYEFQYYHAQH